MAWVSNIEQKEMHILGEEKGLPKGLGITHIKPGDYKTACGKGYFDCGPGEPEILNLENDAINYFRFESANSFFYWESDSRTFKRIWISD